MVVRKIPRSRPRGAVVLETAVIISLVLTLILGVFTYARLLTDWSLVDNAAREGCRYALANNTSSTISSSVQSIVNGYMGGGNITIQQLHGDRERNARERRDAC